MLLIQNTTANHAITYTNNVNNNNNNFFRFVYTTPRISDNPLPINNFWETSQWWKQTLQDSPSLIPAMRLSKPMLRASNTRFTAVNTEYSSPCGQHRLSKLLLQCKPNLRPYTSLLHDLRLSKQTLQIPALWHSDPTLRARDPLCSPRFMPDYVIWLSITRALTPRWFNRTLNRTDSGKQSDVTQSLARLLYLR